MSEPKFHHIGVPCTQAGADEIYVEAAKVHATDPEEHPYRIEFLRFDPDSEMHEAVKNNPHAAFFVDNLEEALKGQNVIIPPVDIDETLRIAFIMDGPAVIELMENK